MLNSESRKKFSRKSLQIKKTVRDWVHMNRIGKSKKKIILMTAYIDLKDKPRGTIVWLMPYFGNNKTLRRKLARLIDF